MHCGKRSGAKTLLSLAATALLAVPAVGSAALLAVGVSPVFAPTDAPVASARGARRGRGGGCSLQVLRLDNRGERERSRT
jgi:hypothetical protein